MECPAHSPCAQNSVSGALSISLAITQNPAGAVLVDDVLTTGSTVDECAKILRKAGFQTVFVVTVMRG